MNKIYIGWEDVGIMIDNLTDKVLQSKENFDGVFGVPRGGLPIAVKIANILNLPLLLYPTKDSLVVDDIADEGVTLCNFKNKKIATLFTTDWTITKPDFFIDKKENQESWIVFPWEDN